MCKKPIPKAIGDDIEDDLRPEYDLSTLLKGAKIGKYAKRYREGTNLILLDPDVAEAFPNAEAVNAALRLVLQLAKLPRPSEPTLAESHAD